MIINVDLGNVRTPSLSLSLCEWASECAYEFLGRLSVCVQHINSVNGHENRIFMKNDLSLMREFIIQIKRKKNEARKKY